MADITTGFNLLSNICVMYVLEKLFNILQCLESLKCFHTFSSNRIILFTSEQPVTNSCNQALYITIIFFKEYLFVKSNKGMILFPQN